ncbi:hypothetical protein [Nocardia sp. NPDC050406]|uniref:hypothetical protein n=1 Tax=Nocardia sp. NPDC050406 TaxID=3364318 RepID=UPI0037AA2B19
MTYPPRPPHGQNMPPQGQPYSAQPQHFPQQQGWGQQPPGPPRPPVWKSPGVLIGAAVAVLAVVVVATAVAVSGGDDAPTTAAVSTTESSTRSAATTSNAATSTKSTTTTKAAPTQRLTPGAQTIVDALPDPLKQAVLKNDIQEHQPSGGLDTFTVEAQFTLTSDDALLSGLMDSDRQRYPMAHIDTDINGLLDTWRTVRKDHLSENGPRVIRIDEGFVNGIKLEFLNTSTKLYFVISGFKDRTSAMAFAERAGL